MHTQISTRVRITPARGSTTRVRARYMLPCLLNLNCKAYCESDASSDQMTNEIPWYDWKAARWRRGIDPESESVS